MRGVESTNSAAGSSGWKPSGATSDYYLDMKPTIFSPEGLNLLADLMYKAADPRVQLK